MTTKAAPFINRELSWLEFNQRVLDEALDATVPLLERVKFFCIVSTNLDEFFEVCVAAIKQQIESGVGEPSLDGWTAAETYRAIHQRVRQMVEQQYRCWREQLVPDLARHGIRFLPCQGLRPDDRVSIEAYYRAKVRPVLTPLAVDPAHPFPQVLNKSLNMIVQLETREAGKMQERLAIVQVPRNLPRLIPLPRENQQHDFVFFGKLIGHFLEDLFGGTRILGYWLFRVTRNSELYIDEEEAANLLRAVEIQLHNRRKGDAVRLEVEPGCPLAVRTLLLQTLQLKEEDLYVVDGPLSPSGLLLICEVELAAELKDPPFLPPLPAALHDQPDLFAAIRERDLLVHHPYESFDSIITFLQQAAQDPNVLAIKQTLYRTGGDARVVGALMDAVRNGKQVTAVVELRARFDEANNIKWARQLEEAGVHVLYGVVGYKIHSKISLIVRQDPDGIRRYVHLSSGNYNASTARLYTDLGLLTCKPDFGEDATNFFNLLTGICQFQGMRKFLVAPFELHGRLIALIAREAQHARQGLPARIIAKMNSLVDKAVIEALYDASEVGVPIDLIVRGICCLRPQLKGLSETITVRSVVDRFLEHSRLFYFENACQPEVFLGSADWMPRNFLRRIELMFPIEDGNLRERLTSEVLATYLADNRKARFLQPDGTYLRARYKRNESPRRCQLEFIALASGVPAVGGRPGTRAAKFPRMKIRTRPNPRSG